MAEVPVILVHEDHARDAYLSYLGLLAHEKADPSLAQSPVWAELKALALHRYASAHEVQPG